MASPAAIGFRAHSGWAAAVAVVEAAGWPVLAARRRIEMREAGATGPSQPYHAAVTLEIGEARELVSRSAEQAAALATGNLRRMVEEMHALGHEVVGCGLLLASGRPLPPIEKILGSHALIHTAEGEFFRDGLRAASEACGLRLEAVPERELFTAAPVWLGRSEDQIQAHLRAMGKASGPPWRQDEKYAALAAWMALSAGARRAHR